MALPPVVVAWLLLLGQVAIVGGVRPAYGSGIGGELVELVPLTVIVPLLPTLSVPVSV